MKHYVLPSLSFSPPASIFAIIILLSPFGPLPFVAKKGLLKSPTRTRGGLYGHRDHNNMFLYQSGVGYYGQQCEKGKFVPKKPLFSLKHLIAYYCTVLYITVQYSSL